MASSESKSSPASESVRAEAAPKESGSTPAAATKSGTDFDVVVAVGKTRDDRGLQVLRARPGSLEAGEVRPLEHGMPIHEGEVVRLKPRQDKPHVCDVETVMESKLARRARPGPAQVASESYRRNWDAIWQRRVPGSSDLN